MLFSYVFYCFGSAYFGFYCIFFCFKQKTAYEMRISDWSSDVCSSDLLARGPLVVSRHHDYCRPWEAIGQGRAHAGQVAFVERDDDAPASQPVDGRAGGVSLAQHHGRARFRGPDDVEPAALAAVLEIPFFGADDALQAGDAALGVHDRNQQ